MLQSQKTSQIIQTQNTKQNPILTMKLNQNKKKEEDQADLTQSGGGEEDERQWSGGRGSAG